MNVRTPNSGIFLRFFQFLFQSKIKNLLYLFVLFLAGLVVLADSGRGNQFFARVNSFPFGDKLGHLVLFGTLTFLVNLTHPGRSWTFLKPKLRISISSATLWIMLLVTLEEFSQLLFRTRTFDLVDLTADFIGILIGALLAKSVIQFRT